MLGSRVCAQARTTPVTAVVTGVRGGAVYARGLWDRLNGGGRRVERSGMPFGLPAPRAQKERRAAAVSALLRDIDSLEQRVQEASKVRIPTPQPRLRCSVREMQRLHTCSSAPSAVGVTLVLKGGHALRMSHRSP